MRHIIIGGDGFVGRHLAARLADIGETVVVGDIIKSPLDVYARVPFVDIDVTKPETLDRLDLKPDDMVYNMSARMLSPLQPKHKRREFFWPVNTTGTENILTWMDAKGATRLVHYTTDMVYGHSKMVPQTEDHPCAPLGEYGLSKLVTEEMCQRYRDKGFRISIFRPRLIIGPGRLGILAKLFKLVDLNLPVPMIGAGRNPYQFVSVFDCAEAALLAWQAGVPNSNYNVGSDNPPAVRDLLARLVEEAGSRSILLPTPAPLVKLTLGLLDRMNMPLMDPEQYLIADEICLLDCSKAKREIGWQPKYKDDDMLIAAYREYRAGRATATDAKSAAVAAAR
jgi:dTDP-glucose 4,6-dehydratase